jgi:hypothetical protein
VAKLGGQHAQRRCQRRAVALGLDHRGGHALHRFQVHAIGQVLEGLPPLGQERQFDRGQREFIAQFGIGAAQFARHAIECGVDREAGFGADDQQVQRIGQSLADCGGALADEFCTNRSGPL